MSIPIPPPLDPELPAAIKIRARGVIEYAAALDEMRAFTAARDRSAADEIWLLQHPPVFTLGASGRREHILGAGSIPIAQSDRGGQVTYHGPGQIVAYALCDLRRRGRGARAFSRALQFAVVDFLAECGIIAFADPSRPGVYARGEKIAAVGLRIRNGASYHGVSVNARMDLSPFARINPCGYPGLRVTQIADLVDCAKIAPPDGDLAAALAPRLGAQLARALA